MGDCGARKMEACVNTVKRDGCGPSISSVFPLSVSLRRPDQIAAGNINTEIISALEMGAASASWKNSARSQVCAPPAVASRRGQAGRQPDTTATATSTGAVTRRLPLSRRQKEDGGPRLLRRGRDARRASSCLSGLLWPVYN